MEERWHNRQPVESVATWENFKFHMQAYFERKETVTMTLARVSGRIWKPQSEKFVDYAENKLKLMQFLNLTEKEKVELLADGVKDPSLRRFALNSWVDTVPGFIEYMHKIPEDSIVPRKQGSGMGSTTNPADQRAEIRCTYCKKTGHVVKDCRKANATCFICGQAGHFSAVCPKRNPAAKPTLNLVTQNQATEVDKATGGSNLREDSAIESIHAIEREVPFVNVYSICNDNKCFRWLIQGAP